MLRGLLATASVAALIASAPAVAEQNAEKNTDATYQSDTKNPMERARSMEQRADKLEQEADQLEEQAAELDEQAEELREQAEERAEMAEERAEDRDAMAGNRTQGDRDDASVAAIAVYRPYSSDSGANMPTVGNDQFSAEQLMDAEILSVDGEEIGDIEDLLIGDNNQVTHVLLEVGGFLELGEHRVALPIDMLKVSEGSTDLEFSVGMTEEQIENLPEVREDMDGNWMEYDDDRM